MISSPRKAQLPTPAEARLLKALWALKQGTVEQIVSFFPPAEQPNYKTTHTFLRIMEAKGFVTHTTRGKVFVFEPVVSEHEVAQASVKSLLRQRFGGSVRGLMVSLLEAESLESEQLRELEGLIRKYRRSRKSEEPAP